MTRQRRQYRRASCRRLLGSACPRQKRVYPWCTAVCSLQQVDWATLMGDDSKDREVGVEDPGEWSGERCRVRCGLQIPYPRSLPQHLEKRTKRGRGGRCSHATRFFGHCPGPLFPVSSGKSLTSRCPAAPEEAPSCGEALCVHVVVGRRHALRCRKSV